MNKRLLSLVFFSAILFCHAQNFTYLTVENGLSNRKVYSIKKDSDDYFWFFTQEGIDRFNGKQFKHYTLDTNNSDFNPFINFNQLHLDKSGRIWVINRYGSLFQYEEQTDKFHLIKKVDIGNNEEDAVQYPYIDYSNNVWLCTSQGQHIYNIDTQETYPVDNCLKDRISSIIQLDENNYCIGTFQGVHILRLQDKRLQLIPHPALDSLSVQASSLFQSKEQHKIIIGCFLKGVYIYDIQTKGLTHLKGLENVNISCIRRLNDKEVIIGTDGAGIYKMNLPAQQLSPYIVADYNESNMMNGNNINDLYVDERKRIWIANYPIGITIFNNHFPSYKWVRHAIGNPNSLINDQVNSVIEDSDGDLWFATNNGISCYNPQNDKWTNLLSSFQTDAYNKNHIFMAICEIAPGIILAGGNTSMLYWIDKKTMKSHYLTPQEFGPKNKVDKYIRSIYRDSKGKIWIGGFYYLKLLDIKERTLNLFTGIGNINCIAEKDSNHIWVGNVNGVYLLDISTKEYQRVRLSVETTSVNALHQGEDGLLYIGTSGNGLLIYNPKTEECQAYRKETCALISNNIYSILPDDEQLILGTENSLTFLNIKEMNFHNWTKEQGLMTNHFNIASGTTTRRNTIVLGSGNGAVEFKRGTRLPQYDASRLIFSDLQIFYQTVYPGQDGSPLAQDIDKTQSIHLKYDQNFLSLYLSTINYDYPSQAIYTWKLEGFYDEWKKPSAENVIRYTNLNPGKYRLHVRAISSEDYHVIQERTLDIVIAPPFWKTTWAMIIYCILGILFAWGILRYYLMQKERVASKEKINFFINTAHDIRTPLTLIKAPLNDLLDKEKLSQEGEDNLQTAIRGANNLLRLVSNLINFEKTNVAHDKLDIGEYELYQYLEENVQQFKPYAESKDIRLTLEANFCFLNVWFDKEKMDSIIRNLISNALKYTPNGGSVRITAHNTSRYWSIEVQDTGIGIPENEQRKLFKMFYRGSNATNMKIPGSGIGLLLAKRLVKKHHGSIKLKSGSDQGSTFTVKFKHGNKHLKANRQAGTSQGNDFIPTHIPDKPVSPKDKEKETAAGKIVPEQKMQKILIVEDNEELSGYLQRTLSETYRVFQAANGSEGADMARAIKPDLIISDIMMPVMRGDEMTERLKNDLETSHIPIILLTALGERSDIINGLDTKADRYITKPFDIGILKAVIKNILANRALLAKQYAQLDLEDTQGFNCTSGLDFQFMSKVKEEVEKNIGNPEYNVDILCAALNMSRTSFYNKIKALTDQAPADFIRTQRMNRAAKLLKEGRHTITEIADLTGFSDSKYFREVFKKHFSMTPSQYIDYIDLNEKQ